MLSYNSLCIFIISKSKVVLHRKKKILLHFYRMPWYPHICLFFWIYFVTFLWNINWLEFLFSHNWPLYLVEFHLMTQWASFHCHRFTIYELIANLRTTQKLALARWLSRSWWLLLSGLMARVHPGPTWGKRTDFFSLSSDYHTRTRMSQWQINKWINATMTMFLGKNCELSARLKTII